MDKPVRDTDAHHIDETKMAKKIKNFIYHPGDLIGSGFSSNVYKGIDQQEADSQNKNIAIKVIQLSKVQNQVEKYLLNNEVNALKLIKHPNVLQTVDILMTKNNVYIVTEFCEDGDLLNFIKNKGKLSQVSALKIVKDIVEGYLCIEQKNIVHRDLKTSNIFLSKGRAKIADFGFCQFVGEKKPQIAYNVGSPAYMSPQSYKQNQYSPKSDIWAIGIVLYQMLYGETPDRNLTYTEMVTNLMNGNIKNITNEEIKKILIFCFKKNLHERIDAKNLNQLLKKQIGRISNTSNNVMEIKDLRTVSQVQHPPPPPPPGPMLTSHAPMRHTSQLPQQRALSPAKHKQISFPNPKIQNTRPNRLSRASHERSFTIDKNSQTKINEPQKQATNIKGHTEMLLFLYRLLKFASEVKIEKIRQVFLVLFRHRIYLDNIVQKCGLQESEQSYKQFQYLKSRFDEVYLQKKQVNSQGLYKDPLAKFSNASFINPQALKLYLHIFSDIAKECIRCLENKPQQINLNQLCIVLDYVMLEHQILNLHLANNSLGSILNTTKIDIVVREQPKRITPAHIELLKLKFQHLIGSQFPFSQRENKNAFQARQTMSMLGNRH